MVDRVIQARYENGVFKPLQPVDLQDQDEVELIVKSTSHQERPTARINGLLLPHLTGPMPDFDEIEDFLETEHRRSMARLFRQIDGDFSEGDADNA